MQTVRIMTRERVPTNGSLIWNLVRFRSGNAIMTILRNLVTSQASSPDLLLWLFPDAFAVVRQRTVCKKDGDPAPHQFGTSCTYCYHMVFSDQDSSAYSRHVNNSGGVSINCTKAHGKFVSLDDLGPMLNSRYPLHFASVVHSRGGTV
jgi:uncharacterized C2H2 Zn-finger protein